MSTASQPLHVTGRVLRAPEVRTAIDPETFRTVPVLQILLYVEGNALPVYIEQKFEFCQLEGAQAAARRYKVGSLLTVDTRTSHMQITLRDVDHIHLLESPQPQRMAA